MSSEIRSQSRSLSGRASANEALGRTPVIARMDLTMPCRPRSQLEPEIADGTVVVDWPHRRRRSQTKARTHRVRLDPRLASRMEYCGTWYLASNRTGPLMQAPISRTMITFVSEACPHFAHTLW